MRTRTKTAARAACLLMALLFLPTALMGGVRLVSHHYGTGQGDGPVITQDVCGAKAPGVVSVSTYAAAVDNGLPAIPILTVSTTPPAPGEAFAQADPGESDKPPQSSVRA